MSLDNANHAPAWGEAPGVLQQDLYCLESAPGTSWLEQRRRRPEKLAVRVHSSHSVLQWLDSALRALLDQQSRQHECSQTIRLARGSFSSNPLYTESPQSNED